MREPLISVIVPVYKAEAYLKRCVDSICGQTYRNLEIILVDDGSPDRSGEICDALALEDSRIRVIHKANGGMSSARNAGLAIARGAYYGFVDSDDWIEKHMYETLYGLIEKYLAQIAVGGLQCDYPDGRADYFNTQYPANRQIELFSTEDALRELTYAEKITNSPCDKLFACEILKGLPMKEGIIYEDTQIMPLWLERASRIAFTPEPLYHYMMTEVSITRGDSKAKEFALMDIHKERVDYYQKNHPQLVGYAMLSYVTLSMWLIHASAGAADCVELRKALIRDVRRMDPRPFFRLLTAKRKLIYCLLRVNATLFTWVTEVYLSRKRGNRK